MCLETATGPELEYLRFVYVRAYTLGNTQETFALHAQGQRTDAASLESFFRSPAIVTLTCAYTQDALETCTLHAHLEGEWFAQDALHVPACACDIHAKLCTRTNLRLAASGHEMS